MSRLGFETPVTWEEVLAAVGMGLAVWLITRRWIGPPAGLARRWGLLVLRLATVGTVGLILLNPVRLTSIPGKVQRPELFYLIDSSQSMTLGSPQSRWDEALQVMRSAADLSPDSPANVRLFRFGQRLQAAAASPELGISPGQQLLAEHQRRARSARTSEPAPVAAKSLTPLAPTDSDTQLMTALRQISSRFGRQPPVGMVIFSDGRTRDEQHVTEVVSSFQRLKVPIHVLPTGSLGKRGDISLVAAVIPPRVRKFSEVEVQVFLRSFGFDGQRLDVELLTPSKGNDTAVELARVPVTLKSGFQAVTLTFRSGTESQPLLIRVPTLAQEISDQNNSLTSQVTIDRTKIRVLYLEGSPRPLTATIVNGRQVVRGPYSDLVQALSSDEDLECVVVATIAGGRRMARVNESGIETSRGFPETKAELAAFDALILSDFPQALLTEQQLQWIEDWVSQRGGGLLMAGGPNSFSSGGWQDSPLAKLLPVEMLPGNDWNSSEQLQWAAIAGTENHPVWSLYTEQQKNRQALSSIPPFTGANRFAAIKPNLTLALATGQLMGTDLVAKKAAPPAGGADLQEILKRIVTAEPGRAPSMTKAERTATDQGISAAVVVGRYGKGRTAALSTAITPPWTGEFNTQWKQGDQNNAVRFWRNLTYWLTEQSSTGRRRLLATADKRFYSPGERIRIQSSAFNELARQTKDYRIVAMIEPGGSLKDNVGDYSPLKWPEGITRTSGEEGPYIAWGEELELPVGGDQNDPVYELEVAIADALQSGAANQSLRLELTAYEDVTQVDSTSLDLQILHDPFELQNPFPNHDLLRRISQLSGGKVLTGSADLAEILNAVPAKLGAPVISRAPLWHTWWLWGWLLLLLTGEWIWRRKLGLA